MPYRKRVVPTTFPFIELFQTWRSYCEHYWIKKQRFYTLLSEGKVRPVYFRKNDANRKLGYRWIRYFMKTSVVFEDLHMKWYVNLYELENKWLTNAGRKSSERLLRLGSLSPNCRENINKKLLWTAIELVKQYWTKRDKLIADGLLDLHNELYEQTSNSSGWPESQSEKETEGWTVW